ncbi:MAG: FtsW/RodA/SpoVE family cell cycle protein [Clostridiales bacterium]|nr:rod shape-determining protein RodA [Clostridiales bacterium]MBR6254426.1 rod shape-determining protein RodA [Clostridiales bacterium]MCR5274306.1 FtsW/RodA/SpoVE family cell cycle protein [Clostridiales bacterium]
MNQGKSGIEFLKNNSLRTVDFWLIIPILSITTIGLYVLNLVLSQGYDGYPTIFYKQVIAAVIGVMIAFVICLLDTQFMKFIGWVLYGVSLMLLVWVIIDGFTLESTWGADSWMKLPVLGTFQPSEMTKIGLVIVSSYVLEDMAAKTISMIRGWVYLGIIYGIPLLMILKQPDFGTAMVIVVSFACMLFIWNMKYRYFLLAISGLIVGVIPIVWNFYLAPYQKKRILSLVFEGSDPVSEYNLVQSKAAVASGGLTGNHTGILVKVPVKESDFIYSAVSERMGFIGTTAIVVLAFFFLVRCLYVASKSSRKAYSYIIVGLTASYAVHFIENMGMCVGLLPITGIPLPFVSMGGTAMMVNFISLGFILNISMDRKSSSG